jgi:H-type small acid-soluble spore protein
MDKKRAKQIIESNKQIEVLYNNFPVWLKKVEEKKGLVEVEDMINDKTIKVPANELKETDLEFEM